jgi:hypothetical protein
MTHYNELTSTVNKDLTQIMVQSLEKSQLALEAKVMEVEEYQDTLAAMAQRVLYQDDVLYRFAIKHRKEVQWRKAFKWWKSFTK